jgi:hypothetical protein
MMSAQSVAQLTNSRSPPGDTKHEGGGGLLRSQNRETQHSEHTRLPIAHATFRTMSHVGGSPCGVTVKLLDI